MFALTPKRLSQPHWQQTRRQAQSHPNRVVLVLQDTTELDYNCHNYNRHKQTQGLGIIGNGSTQG